MPLELRDALESSQTIFYSFYKARLGRSEADFLILFGSNIVTLIDAGRVRRCINNLIAKFRLK